MRFTAKLLLSALRSLRSPHDWCSFWIGPDGTIHDEDGTHSLFARKELAHLRVMTYEQMRDMGDHALCEALLAQGYAKVSATADRADVAMTKESQAQMEALQSFLGVHGAKVVVWSCRNKGTRAISAKKFKAANRLSELWHLGHMGSDWKQVTSSR